MGERKFYFPLPLGTRVCMSPFFLNFPLVAVGKNRNLLSFSPSPDHFLNFSLYALVEVMVGIMDVRRAETPEQMKLGPFCKLSLLLPGQSSHGGGGNGRLWLGFGEVQLLLFRRMGRNPGRKTSLELMLISLSPPPTTFFLTIASLGSNFLKGSWDQPVFPLPHPQVTAPPLRSVVCMCVSIEGGG